MSLRRSLPLIAAGVAIWTIAASVDGDAMAPGVWIVFAAAALSALAVFLEPGDDIEDSDDTVDRRPGGLAGSAPYRRIAPRRAGVRPAGSHGSRPGCDIEIAPDKP